MWSVSYPEIVSRLKKVKAQKTCRRSIAPSTIDRTEQSTIGQSTAQTHMTHRMTQRSATSQPFTLHISPITNELSSSQLNIPLHTYAITTYVNHFPTHHHLRSASARTRDEDVRN